MNVSKYRLMFSLSLMIIGVATILIVVNNTVISFPDGLVRFIGIIMLLNMFVLIYSFIKIFKK